MPGALLTLTDLIAIFTSSGVKSSGIIASPKGLKNSVMSIDLSLGNSALSFSGSNSMDLYDSPLHTISAALLYSW